MIRPYSDSDLTEVLDVWYSASLKAHPFLSEEFLETERRLIAEEWLPASETFVFEFDERVVGSVSMHGNEVGGLFVAPEYQRRGIGGALLDHVGASRPHLELDVFKANTAARAFYRSYGFRFVNEHVNEDTGQPELRLRFDKI